MFRLLMLRFWDEQESGETCEISFELLETKLGYGTLGGEQYSDDHTSINAIRKLFASHALW